MNQAINKITSTLSKDDEFWNKYGRAVNKLIRKGNYSNPNFVSGITKMTNAYGNKDEAASIMRQLIERKGKL